MTRWSAVNDERTEVGIHPLATRPFDVVEGVPARKGFVTVPLLAPWVRRSHRVVVGAQGVVNHGYERSGEDLATHRHGGS